MIFTLYREARSWREPEIYLNNVWMVAHQNLQKVSTLFEMETTLQKGSIRSDMNLQARKYSLG